MRVPTADSPPAPSRKLIAGAAVSALVHLLLIAAIVWISPSKPELAFLPPIVVTLMRPKQPPALEVRTRAERPASPTRPSPPPAMASAPPAPAEAAPAEQKVQTEADAARLATEQAVRNVLQTLQRCAHDGGKLTPAEREQCPKLSRQSRSLEGPNDPAKREAYANAARANKIRRGEMLGKDDRDPANECKPQVRADGSVVAGSGGACVHFGKVKPSHDTHEPGYAWARQRQLDRPEGCDSLTPDLREGCLAYVAGSPQ